MLNVLALVIILALPAIVIALIAFVRKRDKPDSGKTLKNNRSGAPDG